MRIYTSFTEALGEIRRELNEMGIIVRTKTWQDKNVEDDAGFETFELQNYVYTVTWPNTMDLEPTQPWAGLEFAERVGPVGFNPGQAWLARQEVWEEFIEPDGQFSYTYSMRMQELYILIANMKEDLNARQHFLSIWDRRTDLTLAAHNRRAPCSLGYLFQFREGKLNITYFMRSADFVTHFQNDIWLATMLLHHVANKLDVPIGMFTHFVASLHVFKKDVEDAF